MIQQAIAWKDAQKSLTYMGKFKLRSVLSNAILWKIYGLITLRELVLQFVPKDRMEITILKDVSISVRNLKSIMEILQPTCVLKSVQSFLNCTLII